jgi:hypothetical protein
MLGAPVAKRKQLQEYILNEIRLGRLRPGDRVYSRSAFMTKFGCARATVDQVISDLVGSRTLVAQKGRGTFVAGPATRKAGTRIAIAAPVLGHPSLPQLIVHGLLEALGGDREVRFFTYEDLKQPQAWESCKAQRGVVFVQPDAPHSPLLYEARAQGVPHLVLYRDPPESPFISIDNRGGIAALVDALYARGCRRIAYAGGRPGRYHAPEQRYSGYLEGLLRNRLPLDKSLAGLVNPGAEEKFLAELFRLPDKPDAVIAAELASGLVIKAAEARGLVMGRDVLLGQLDEVPANTYPFRVLSLRSIAEEVGREGARALPELIAAPGMKVQRYIAPDVVEQ